VFCGPPCRSLAFAAKNRRGVKVSERQRAMLWQALVEFDLVSGPMPPKKKG
jgi:hypothetical protein